MALIKPDARSKILVLLIISGCVGIAILLGIVIFELPWKSDNTRSSARGLHSQPSTWTLSKVENDTEALNELQNLECNYDLSYLEKAEAFLKIYPVFDGHNDLPWNLRKIVQNNLDKFNFSSNLTLVEPWSSYNKSTMSHTDLPRLKAGHVGAQFWVAYTECGSQGKDSVMQTLEQIDLIHRLIEKYSDHLQFCTTAQCVMEASFKNGGKIASLIGIEGGHSIQSSPGVLRQMYKLGARYLTLTHSCNTPWADASPVDDPSKNASKLMSGGLSQFGLELIDEMNRIGMMVDLSHVSEATMTAALKRSKAPVIFSHSGAKAICDVHRNVGDEVLKLLKENGGVIMINFYSSFVSCEDPPRRATLNDVVRHFEHIRDLIGVEHIGIGGDYDGVDSVPQGLEDVSKYPHLFANLLEQGWRLGDLKKIAYTNLLRVMNDVEQVKYTISQDRSSSGPMETFISTKELEEKGFIDAGADGVIMDNSDSGACLTSKSLPRLGNSTTN